MKKDTQNNNIGVYTESDGITIGINGKRYRKHKLILKQFFYDYSETKTIYHKNGDKFVNHLDNLTTNFLKVALLEKEFTELFQKKKKKSFIQLKKTINLSSSKNRDCI